MSARSSFDYAIIRVVPRVEREEFINVGVILFCRTRRFLEARIELDSERLRALFPGADVAEVERHLAFIPLVCAGDEAAGPIAGLPLAGRFHWLVSPRSTIIQSGPVHSGIARDLEAEVELILDRMVRVDPA